jgi:hypothetical protein
MGYANDVSHHELYEARWSRDRGSRGIRPGSASRHRSVGVHACGSYVVGIILSILLWRSKVSTLRLYSPAIVLASWAIIWELGLRSQQLVGAALALTAVCVFNAERERRRKYK